MKKIFTGICLSLLFLPLSAKESSFAIIVDSVSYERCKASLEKYAKSVTDDGLAAFISVSDWDSPEQVRDSLKRFYSDRNIEGAVFVGDIPIPMIRKAQFLTSAFKMDEDQPIRESSVPSDRYYDDFDLKFDFIGRDSTQTNLFYYNLSYASPQYIECDIYTGRIKPSSKFGDKYEELSAYLEKTARVKAEDNILDEITSYTGDGSFSNSLIAWKDETITLAEQMPYACSGKKEPAFYVFAMQPFMKETIIDEIRRDDLDLVLFHEHGMPERQYLTGYPEISSYDESEYYEAGRFHARNLVRTKMRYGKTLVEAEKSIAEEYGADSVWYAGALDPETVAKDSLYDLKTGIILEDIQAAAPNVRLAVFDACYNGDFREQDCVASRYIFAGGNSVAAVGNSVNVLQDKSSSDLMGMLSEGYRVGEWMKLTNILESHIMGDPTYHFKRAARDEKPDLSQTSTEYWLGYVKDGSSCALTSLALHRLFALGYKDMSSLLADTYDSSPFYMVRLQCMHLSAHYNDGNYASLLKKAVDDPYEFIRRKAIFYMGKVGSEDLPEYIVKAYLNDYNSKRVAFNVGFSAGHFPAPLFSEVCEKEIAGADFIKDKELFSKDAQSLYRSAVSLMQSTGKAIADYDGKTASRSMYINGMRNNPYPHLAADLVGLVKSGTQDLSLRIQAAEVLGWFVRAWNRDSIHSGLKACLDANPDMPEELSAEITKTLARLEHYMK